MTKKHFKAVAAAVKPVYLENLRIPQVRDELDKVIDNLVSELRQFNSQFDSDKFREACGQGYK